MQPRKSWKQDWGLSLDNVRWQTQRATSRATPRATSQQLHYNIKECVVIYWSNILLYRAFESENLLSLVEYLFEYSEDPNPLQPQDAI